MNCQLQQNTLNHWSQYHFQVPQMWLHIGLAKMLEGLFIISDFLLKFYVHSYIRSMFKLHMKILLFHQM